MIKASELDCNCKTGGENQAKTVDSAINAALQKFKLPQRFNNLAKLGELGMTDKQLSVLLYSLESDFKCDLGCPIEIDKWKNKTIVELKTQINKYGK